MVSYQTLTFEIIDAAKTPQAGVYWITPAFAAEALEKRNKINRNISELKVLQIVSDIETDRFECNGETIIFGNDGSVIDAQHRLSAIVKAGKPVLCFVSLGVNPHARMTVDQGKNRDNGDRFAMMGYANSRQLPTVVKHVYGYHATGGTGFGRQGLMSGPATEAYIRAHPKLEHDLVWAMSLKTHCEGVVVPSHLAITRAILEPSYGQAAVDFLEQVAKGHNLAANHPALVARERLRREIARLKQYRSRVTELFAVELLMRAFLAHYHGRTPIKFMLDGTLPKINKPMNTIRRRPLMGSTAFTPPETLSLMILPDHPAADLI